MSKKAIAGDVLFVVGVFVFSVLKRHVRKMKGRGY
jgi:hypothetical protein